MSSDKVAQRKGHNLFTLLAYGAPALVTSFPLVPFAVYLPAYYAEVKQLGFLVVGVALFLSRLIDAVSDPVIGYLSDKYIFLGHRRKSWMVIGGIISGFALLQLTQPPASVSVWYLGAWSAVLYIGWTMIMVPYMALAADIADSYVANTRLSFFREVFSLFGTLAAIALPLVFEGPPLDAIFGIVAPIGVVAFLLMWLLVPESDSAVTRAAENWWDVKEVIQIPFTRRLCIVWFLTATASAIPAALFPVYVTTVLGGGETQKATVVFVYFAAAVVGMPLFSWVSRTRSKHHVMAFSMFVVCLVFPFAIFLTEGDIYLFGIICVLTGFMLAAELLLGPSMLADAAGLYKQKSGKDLTAFHCALWGVISKAAFAFAILVAFSLVELATQYASESMYPLAVAVVYAGLPAFFKLPAAKLLWNAPFSQKERDLIYAEKRIKTM